MRRESFLMKQALSLVDPFAFNERYGGSPSLLGN
jgi:hypothetical protein